MATQLIGNISIEQNFTGTTIRIPSKKSWQVIFLAAWLAFWLYGPFDGVWKAWTHLTHPDSETWFMLFWSIGWVFGIGFASSALLWSLGGVDALRITSSEVEWTRSIFGIVIKRKLTPIDRVRNLRYMPGNPDRFRGFRPGRICYEDGNYTVNAGDGFYNLGLKDAEAFAIIETMLSIYPFQKKDRAMEYMDTSLISTRERRFWNR